MSGDLKHAAWITAKVKATLLHYPTNWKEDQAVRDLSMDDWVDALSSFSKKSIDRAFMSYVQSEEKIPPSPASIRQRAKASESDGGPGQGDRSKLSMDKQYILTEKVLPTARRWMMDYPPRHPMYEHAKTTLGFWGELEGAA